MNAMLGVTLQRARDVAGHRLTSLAAPDRLWCAAVLPDGTQGHWFFATDGSLLVFRDPDWPSHGEIVHQCPVHRWCLGSIGVPSTTANEPACGSNLT